MWYRKSGIVKTAICCLEEDGLGQHIIDILALDGGGRWSSEILTVIVKMLDSVVGQMEMSGGSSQLLLREDTPVGTVVTKVKLSNIVNGIETTAEIIPDDPYLRDMFRCNLTNNNQEIIVHLHQV